jgi:polyhydroxybutyrate depolymerase
VQRPPVVPPPEPSIEQRSVIIDRLQRKYRLFTPSTLARRHPVPLVIALHGGGNTAESLVGTTQLDQAAEGNGFVVAYPEGVRRAWNAGFCCTAGRPDIDDVGFIFRVIDDVLAARPIDSTRIYAVGISNGAIMAYRLACEAGGRIAGVGSVAGAMLLDDCHPSRPISVIELHGTADEAVPFKGGPLAPLSASTQPVPGARALVERWALLNECPPIPEMQVTGPVAMTTWTSCRGDASVRLAAVEGGGHTWFSSEFGPIDGAIDATRTLVDFLPGLHGPG